MSTPNCKTLVVVPMKDLSQAKTRLADKLNTDQRAHVAAELFAQTLSFLKNAQQRSRIAFDIAVVTSSPEIARVVKDRDLQLIREAGEQGLNAALSTASKWAQCQGYDTLCILPADIASPDFDEFERLLGLSGPSPSLVLCPAHDYGTNVLIASPPNAISFRYGASSFLKHQSQAALQNIDCVIAPSSSFSQDVDHIEDLRGHLPQLLEKLSDRRAV